MILKSPTRYFQKLPSGPRSASPMLRGFSSGLTRSFKKFKMRLAFCGSSLPSSRSAARSNSILHAIAFHQFGERNCTGLAGAQSGDPFFGQMKIFEVCEMFQDGLADIIGFCPAGALGERVQAGLDLRRQTDGKHGEYPRMLYTYISNRHV